MRWRRIFAITFTVLVSVGCQLRSPSPSAARPPGPVHRTILAYTGSDPAHDQRRDRDYLFLELASDDARHRLEIFTDLLTTDSYRTEHAVLASHEGLMWDSYTEWQNQAALRALKPDEPALNRVVARFYHPGIAPGHLPSEEEQLARAALRLVGQAAYVTVIHRTARECRVRVSTSPGPLSGGAFDVHFALRDCRDFTVWLPVSLEVTAIY